MESECLLSTWFPSGTFPPCNYFVCSKGSLWADYSFGGLVDCCCLLWWEPGVRTCTRQYSTKGGTKKHGSVSHSNLPLHMAQGYSYCLYTEGNRTKAFNGRGEINSQILCWGKMTYCFEICAFALRPKSPGKWLSEWGKWIKGPCRKAYLNRGDCRGKLSGVKMESDTEQPPLGSVLGPVLFNVFVKAGEINMCIKCVWAAGSLKGRRAIQIDLDKLAKWCGKNRVPVPKGNFGVQVWVWIWYVNTGWV